MKRLIIVLFLGLILVLVACSPGPAPEEASATPELSAPSATPVPPTDPPTDPPPPPTETPVPSPTAAPTHTPEPDPIEGDPLLLLGEPSGLDNFNTENNWTFFDNECFKSEITDGFYTQTAKGVANTVCWEVTWPLLENYYIETQVIIPEVCNSNDRYGLLYRAPDNLRGYLYGLTCEGQYTLTLWDGQQTTTFVNATSSPVINSEPGHLNRLGLMVFSGNYDIYINGVYQERVTDFTFTEPGKIGYYVRAATEDPFTVQYDSLAVWNVADQLYPPDITPPQTTPIPPPASGEPSATALTYVNVRTGPSVSYPVLFVASPGATGEVIGRSANGSWWAIKVPTSVIGNGTGWVSGSYVATTNTANVPIIGVPPLPPTQIPPTAQPGGPTGVTTQNVNVREGPGTQYPSYGVVSQGTSAKIIGKDAPTPSWWAFELPTSTSPNGTGWISADYIIATNAGNVPIIEPPPEENIITVPEPDEGAPSAVTIEPVNVRAGPGNDYESYGKIVKGTVMAVIGKSEDGEFWVIQVSTDIAPSGQGWVISRVTQSMNTADVPVFPAP